jgi:hypothetical protein
MADEIGDDEPAWQLYMVSSTRVVAALLAIRDWSIAIMSRVDSSAMTGEWNQIRSIPAIPEKRKPPSECRRSLVRAGPDYQR